MPSSVEDDEANIPTGSTISYNPTNWDSPCGDKGDPVAGLVYELIGHGYATDKGL